MIIKNPFSKSRRESADDQREDHQSGIDNKNETAQPEFSDNSTYHGLSGNEESLEMQLRLLETAYLNIHGMTPGDEANRLLFPSSPEFSWFAPGSYEDKMKIISDAILQACRIDETDSYRDFIGADVSIGEVVSYEEVPDTDIEEDIVKNAEQNNDTRPALQAAGFLDRSNCKGKWTLDWEGTLNYSGYDLLVSDGGAYSFKSKVKRIVIDGFWYVGPGLFQSYTQCEEVVFNRAFVQLDTRVFAHCHKLMKVIYEDEIADLSGDAFRDTPYQAALEGRDFVPEGRDQNIISAGAYGRMLIEQIQEEIELMYTMKSAKDDPVPGPWNYDEHLWFDNCIDTIFNGAEAGEPALMYLVAELRTNVISDDGYDLIQMPLYGNEKEFYSYDPSELYLRAAEAGSSYAKLWCAFCMSEGKYGFAQDPGRAEAFLRGVVENGEVPPTIGLSELRFMSDEVDKIVEIAYDLDREEDEIGDRYNFVKGTYEHLLPDPDWRTLHLRCVDLVCFMKNLGLPYSLKERGYDYKYSPGFRDSADRVAAAKTEWTEWCRSKGLSITLV